jgi:raffinose/stachyose/melibiose transport system permease protein
MTRVNIEQRTAWEKLQISLTGSKMGKFIVYICLIGWSVTTIFPLLWVFNNSFKESNEVMSSSFTLPSDPTFENYIRTFESMNLLKSYLNSLIMSGGTVLFVLLFGGMAAFIISRFSFKIRGLLQGLLVISLLIPNFATVVPVYEILINLGLINTYWGLIIPHTAGFLPFTVLVISGYMATIPKEMEEAAVMDGCNRLKMYTKIFIPMSRPAFATASIFTFLWSYNDLFASLIFVNHKETQPIVLLLNNVSSQYGTDYGLMATAITVTVIPVLIVYVILQKYIEKGLTSGAVKG